jgi:hypothetical protein
MINAQKSVVFPFFPFSTEIIPAHTRLMAKISGPDQILQEMLYISYIGIYPYKQA